jgi:CRP/FNR family cyclic AMP-dependent transcriptional regulator
MLQVYFEPMDNTTTLKSVPLFAGMNDEQIAAIARIMEEKHFSPGQVIIREGEPGDYFHVIVKGQVEYLSSDAEGNELILDTARPGGFFGELSMLTGSPRVIRVRAKEAVDTLALDQKEFFDFLKSHPQAAIDVLKALGQRLYTTDKLLRQSVSKNVNEIIEEQSTPWQRIADVIANVSASMPFVMLHVFWFGGWMIWNLIRGKNGFDPFPFGFLTMVVSLEAIFLSIFVLISQNRSGDKDRISAVIDHQVNVRAEVKTGLIMNRLDDLERSMHYLHAEQSELLKKLTSA